MLINIGNTKKITIKSVKNMKHSNKGQCVKNGVAIVLSIPMSLYDLFHGFFLRFEAQVCKFIGQFIRQVLVTLWWI